MRTRLIVFVVWILAIAGNPPLTPASTSTSWRGVLFDEAGKPVGGAIVHLHGAQPVRDYEGRTLATGEFQFPNVEPGEYRLSVTIGAKEWTLGVAFGVPEGAPLNFEIVLTSLGQT